MMAGHSTGIDTLPEMPIVRSETGLTFDSQKDYSSSSEKDVERDAFATNLPEDEEGFVVDKENPVILTGEDVSNYAVAVTDLHDPAITARSLILGTIIAGLGAALFQIYIFKPVNVNVSTVFLLLLIYALGKSWEYLIPVPHHWLDSPRAVKRWTAMSLRFINPGNFGLKEHTVATLIANTAAYGSQAVNSFAVQRLFYNSDVSATTAVLATFSTACFGYGIVGLLRPLTVYPSEMVYWGNLPSVLTLQALHFDKTRSSKRLKLFWTVLTGTAVYELFPQYIFPLLNGVSIPCLVTQGASESYRRVITNVFGGGAGNEGLGLFELSFDWQYITSSILSFPILQQANSWAGYAICYAAVLGIYYTNIWNSKNLPLLSTSIFSNTSTPGNPVVYDQTVVFGPTFTLNETALAQQGLPLFTGSYVWSLMTSNWAIGGLLAHCIFFWGPYVVDSFKMYSTYRDAATKRTVEKRSPASSEKDEKPALVSEPTKPGSVPIQNLDRHFAAMARYNEAPWYWYTFLLVISFLAGLIVVIKGGTTLPVWGYIVALLVGSFIAPFSNLLYARLGNGIATNQLVKMIAGGLHPGKPVANLYFSMWSHDVISTSIGLAGDLKMGQYLKIPPRVMFLSQVWGTILGCFINYVVMISIVTDRREVLLDPQGTNVWSGQTVQKLNSLAVTWSLAFKEFNIHSQYVWIPVSILLGFIPTTIQYFIWKRWPKIGPVKVDHIILPVIYQYAQWMTSGVNSVIASTIIVGVISQVWLRRNHPRWFRKYIYILGGALDGGTQIMVFILSFAVFGASGSTRPFPTWWGNPDLDHTVNIDYCIYTN